MKNILLILILFADAQAANAQVNKASAKESVRWKITTKATELFLINFPVTVERRFNFATLGLTVAYRPSLQESGRINGTGKGMSGLYQYQYAFNFVPQGIYLGLNSKQYFFRGRGADVYLDFDVYCRSWWYKNKYAEYNNGPGYRFNATRNELVNIRGFKALVGRSFVFNRHKKIKTVVDLYAGPGMRYKTWEYESYNGMVQGQPVVYKKDAGGEWQISAHGGVQVGIGF